MGDEPVGEEPMVRAAEVEPAVARGPRPTPFGSVWDSQLGGARPMLPAAGIEPLEEEDFDEPEIPEYLIAEQRRGRVGGGAGRGTGRGAGRGGRSAYTAAVERERYGRGGGGGGINRYPDVGARDRDRDRPRSEPFVRRDRPAGPPRGGGSEPWSEVPPELEAMLRAQIASKPRPAGATQPASPPAGVTEAPESTATDEAAPAPAPKRRTTRRTAATAGSDVSSEVGASTAEEAAAPKRRTTRRRTAAPEGETA